MSADGSETYLTAFTRIHNALNTLFAAIFFSIARFLYRLANFSFDLACDVVADNYISEVIAWDKATDDDDQLVLYFGSSEQRCGTCGHRLEAVRPGKWQCPNQGMPGHD